jgi:hypothetical protein
MGRVMTHAAPAEVYNLLLVCTVYTWIEFFTLAGTLSLCQVQTVRARATLLVLPPNGRG